MREQSFLQKYGIWIIILFIFVFFYIRYKDTIFVGPPEVQPFVQLQINTGVLTNPFFDKSIPLPKLGEKKDMGKDNIFEVLASLQDEEQTP